MKPVMVLRVIDGLASSVVEVVRTLPGDRRLVCWPNLTDTDGRPITAIVPAHLLEPMHRTGDPATSIAAAKAQTGRIRDTQHVVLQALDNAGRLGLTDHEHEPINRLLQDSAGKRRGELVAMGFVTHSGRTRPSPRGRESTVWVVTFAGQQYLRAQGGAA